MTQRTKRAKKQQDQLTLFASWAPNMEVSLHSATEAVAHVQGKEPERGATWLRDLVGATRVQKRRRVIFPAKYLDRIAWVRPPARITLDPAAQAVANTLHAHALGLKPLKVTKHGRRILASSPRGWPTGMRVKDTPWPAIETLIHLGLPLTIDDTAKSAIGLKLQKSGTRVATASLAGSSILLETTRPELLESLNLPALSYIGDKGDGTYRLPLLCARTLLDQPMIAVPDKVATKIKKATRKPRPLTIDDPNFPWTLWDFQAIDAGRGTNILETTGGVLFAGGMGSGKAIREDTGVMTPSGQIEISKLQPGDFVLAPDGRPTRVKGVYPHRNWPMWRITFSDKTQVFASPEHRWWVQTPGQKHRGTPGRFMTTWDMARAGLKETNGNRRFYIPMTEPLQFEEKNLPVPPYTLGALLGDGHLGPQALGFSDNDGDVVAEMVEDLRGTYPEVLFVPEHPVDYKDWRVNNAGRLKRELDDLGLWGCRAWEKHIPEEYLYGSVNQRLALLQGLLDTDGGSYGNPEYGNHKAQSGHVEFTSTSENLADAVVWLTQSMGGTASKSAPVRKTYRLENGEKRRGRPAWRVRVSLPAEVEPFRIKVKAEKYTPRSKYQPTRGVESIEYFNTDDACCIEVEHPSHQFVIEHGIVTGNTTVSLGVAHEKDLFPLLVVSPLSAFSTWERQLGEMGKSFYLATGSPKKNWEEIREGDFDAYVVSYDRLESLKEVLESKHLTTIIGDELQRIKNPGSKRSRALRAMATSVPYRIGLSGTPLTSLNLGDLLAQGNFLVPGEWPPRAGKKTLEDRYPGDPVESIADHLGSIMVRRKITEVGRELPDREDRRVFVSLTPEQRKALVDLEEEARRAKEDGEFDGSNAKFNALVKLQRMRQIVANPKAAGIGGQNPKLDAGLKLVKQFRSEGRRGVVFVADRPSYRDMADLLTKAGIPWSGIWGSSSAQERIEAERKLHAKEVDVVLCTIAAAAESWSASPTATFAVFCSYIYSAATLEQAEARVHRLNSDLDGPVIQIVYVHATDPAVEQSVDDRTVEILGLKKELFAKVIDREVHEDKTETHGDLGDLLYVLTGERDEKADAAAKDQRRVAGEVKRRKEHAKETLYRGKQKN